MPTKQKGKVKKMHKRPKPVAHKPKRRPFGAKAQIPQNQASGYDEALLRSIIMNGSEQRVSPEALEFSELLCSLTPSMIELHHKSGFSIGRSLYRIFSSMKRYTWYEESVADLVSFLEKAGFSNIAYNAFPDTVSIKFYDRKAHHIGVRLHTFEAGLISGFVTAARHQLTEIVEIRCSRNGSQFCEFANPEKSGNITAMPDREAMAKLIEKISSEASGAAVPAKNSISMEYYMLVSSILFRKEYSHALRNIASYIGGEFAGSLKLSGARTSLAKAEALTRLLNLGSLTIKSLKPVDIELMFDRLESRRELADISLAFLNGLLNNLLKDKAKIETLGTRNSKGYKVRLIERK